MPRKLKCDSVNLMADISITAANVLQTPGAPLSQGVAAVGVTITQGQVVYQLANGTYGLADSNGTSPANSVAGIAVNAASPGQTFQFVPKDATFTFGGTSTAGLAIYLSNTPGGITSTYSELASGSTVICVGGVLTGGATMNLNPQVWGVK